MEPSPSDAAPTMRSEWKPSIALTVFATKKKKNSSFDSHWKDTSIIISNLSGGHVHARGSILKPVERHSHLAAPGVCTTMDASLPGAKIPENSNY